MTLRKRDHAHYTRLSWHVCVSSILTLLLFTFNTNRLSACDCAGAPATTHLQNAEVVFYGEIIATTLTDEGVPDISSSGRLVSLRVVQHWKGRPTETIEVRMPTNSGVCGLDDPQIGESVLVFAIVDSEGALYTHGCMGTDSLCSPVSGYIKLQGFVTDGIDELNPDAPSNEDLIEMCGETVPLPAQMCGLITLPLTTLLLVGIGMFRLVQRNVSRPW